MPLREGSALRASTIAQLQDEQQQRDLKLQLRYGRIWIEKVFPVGTTADRVAAAAGASPSPVLSVVYHHDHGAGHTTLAGQDLCVLEPGRKVFAEGQSTFREPLPPSFPQGMRYLPGLNSDWSNTEEDYLTLTFSRRCTVYILLNTLANEPRWLREHFFKLRDPNFVEVHLKADWRFNLAHRLQLMMIGRLADWRRSTLRVFRSKRVFSAGDTLVLGGPGLANMTDSMYLVAFQPTARPRMNASGLLPIISLGAHEDTLLDAQVLKAIHGEPSLQPSPFSQHRHAASQHIDSPTLSAAGHEVVPSQQSATLPQVGILMSPKPRRRQSQLQAYPGAQVSFMPGPQSYCGSDRGSMLSMPGDEDEEGGRTAGSRPLYRGNVAEYHIAFMHKFVKCIKRSRLANLKRLIATDLSYSIDVSFLHNYDLTWLNLSTNKRKKTLAVEKALLHGQVEMLCILVSQCGCAMSYPALKFLVHHWEEVPAQYGSAMQILANYICQHPAPLAVICAFMRAIRFEIQQRVKRKPAAELEAALADLQRLQLLVLQALQEVQRRAGADSTELLPRVQRILDPKVSSSKRTRLLSELPPLRLALLDNDAHFISAPLVSAYMHSVWMGGEYILETCKDGAGELTLLDPSFSYVSLMNVGFAPRGLDSLASTQRMYFLLTWGQQAFFNSPRARWAMELLGLVLYMLVFQQVVGAKVIPLWTEPLPEENVDPNDNSWIESTTWSVAAFCVFTLGSVLDALLVLVLRQRGNVLKYVEAHPGASFYLLVDIVLLFITITMACWLHQEGPLKTLTENDLMILVMVWGALAPFVSGRLLYTLVPMITSLGPMLTTMKEMLKELLVFLLPWSCITIGFAVALQVVYSGIAKKYDDGAFSAFDSFWETIFVLLRGFTASDKLEVHVFDDLPTAELRTYGKAILMLYTISTVLLMGNLLIAIIAHRYQPEKVQQQAALNMAHIIDDHKHQVDTAWLSSPWSVFQLMFFWVPGGRRRKLHMSKFFQWSLPFLDGFKAASGTLYPTLPTGRYEIPHLIYLLTLHPLIIATWLVCFILHSPFCILFFAFSGHTKLVKELKALVGMGSFTAEYERVMRTASTLPVHPSGFSHRNQSAGNLSTSVSCASSIAGHFETADSSGLNDDTASDIHRPSVNLNRRRVVDFVTRVATVAVFLVVGLLVFVFVYILGLTLTVLYAWFSAVAFSVFNIMRGLWEPLQHTFQAWRDRQNDVEDEGGDDLSDGTQLTQHDGDRTSAPRPWADVPETPAVRHAPSSPPGPKVSLHKLLYQLHLTAKEKHIRDPAYVDSYTLQTLIRSVFGQRVALADAYYHTARAPVDTVLSLRPGVVTD